MKKLVIAGGSGFIGTVLAQHFKTRCEEVVILSRSPQSPQGNICHVFWDAKTLGPWVAALEGSEVLINLTGKNVNCRYTPQNKQEILASRLDSTNVLGEALQHTKNPPRLWLQAGSSTIYNHSFTPNTESSTNIGNDFSMTVCKKWEEAFWAQPSTTTKKVLLRIAIVLGKEGGALPVLHRLTKWGLGGHQGNGNQMVSWIDKNDFSRAIEWIMKQSKLKHVYNICHPNVVPNRQFMGVLRKVARMPIGIPHPAWLLEVGSAIIGTETELVLKSRAVAPAHLVEEGFQFHVELRNAMRDLVTATNL